MSIWINKRFDCFFVLLLLLILTFSRGNIVAQEIDYSSKKLFLSYSEALQNPDSVYKLCMGGQDLKQIPEDIIIFNNLREINLSQNFIQEIPDYFCSLVSLREIKLSNNGLKKISDKFSNLKNLKRLDLSNNPDIFDNKIFGIILCLNDLEELDLSFNNLKSLPDTLCNLKKLKILDLSGNKFEETQKQKIRNCLKNTKIEF